MQVVRRAAGRDLGNQLRRTLDVVVPTDACLPADRGIEEQRHVRLRLVVEIEADGWRRVDRA